MVYNNDCNNFNMRLHKDVYSHTRHLTPVPLPHGHVKLIDTPAGGAGVTGGGGAEPGQPLKHVVHGPVHRVPLTLVASSGMSPDTLPQLWQHSEISRMGNTSSTGSKLDLRCIWLFMPKILLCSIFSCTQLCLKRLIEIYKNLNSKPCLNIASKNGQINGAIVSCIPQHCKSKQLLCYIYTPFF